MKIFGNETLTGIVNNNKLRTLASNLTSPKALLPIIILEAGVTAGRTYQAYKRGGIIEAKERIIDESISAGVWLFGITGLNCLFDKIIGKTGIFDKKGLSEIKVDVGSDIIRNPLKKAIEVRPEIKNKLTSLKFTKIAMASLIGVYLSGIMLPKFYQKITANTLKKQKKNNNNNNKPPQSIEHKVSINEFLKKTKQKDVTFNGLGDTMGAAAHLMENNQIVKLLTIDGGLFLGRAKSTRNKDEMIEILFRDLASTFFYMLSTPLIFFGLSKIADKFKGKNTNIDPNTAHFINEQLSGRVKAGMNLNDYNRLILGNSQNTDGIIAAIKDKTIDIKHFEELLKSQITDSKEISRVTANAKRFLDLRPDCASKSLLTISEIKNSLGTGLANDAEFLTNAVKTATKGKSQNAAKFVSFKEIDKIKIKAKEYLESVAEYASKAGQGEITPEILKQVKNRNMVMKLFYNGIGLGVSILFLSTIIPKIQYYITEKRTGSKEFPGIKGLV
ncbi:MAG: hypothetical protein PHX18_03925 [Candidatus Gastranaerophilales bacterium]|nr:hypothetical protein [Candidatus Gastranaerophilales bacterium]